MTDRELLDLAAKAYQHSNPAWNDEPFDGFRQGFMENWNPLTDDGDALRLAVKLRFHVCVFSATDDGLVPMPGFVEVGREEDNDPLSVEYVDGAEYESATRLAIVRAAAEIGRATP